MLIEYRVKFEEGGFTVTQRVEPSASEGQIGKHRVPDKVVVSNSLDSSFDPPESGSGDEDSGKTGGGDEDSGKTGGGPACPGWTIIFGPIVIGSTRLSEEGGGDEDSGSTGGTLP